MAGVHHNGGAMQQRVLSVRTGSLIFSTTDVYSSSVMNPCKGLKPLCVQKQSSLPECHRRYEGRPMG